MSRKKEISRRSPLVSIVAIGGSLPFGSFWP
jgi:hypothetical protein